MTAPTTAPTKTAESNHSGYSPSALVTGTTVSLLLQAATLLALFIALFAFIQYGTPALAGTDGYYHIKMGYLIRQQGLKPDFPWLPYTILNPTDFYDHHLLYHVYLALFASVDPAVDGGLALTQGAKFASILMPSLAFVAIWWLLRSQRVPWPALWAVGLFAVSEAFLYRLSMPRAQSASLLVLVLGLHWLLQSRYRLLLPLGFVYVWLYNAFPLLLMVAAVYIAATLLLERRLAWSALIYPALGIGLGLVLNPYFPQNVTFILDHLLTKVGESAVPVGVEWDPYNTWTVVINSGMSLLVFLLGALALGWQPQRLSRNMLVAYLLSILFGLMLFRSRRFIEYFPAFSLIFLAFSATPLLRQWCEKRPGLNRLLPLALSLLLAIPLSLTVTQARTSLAGSKAADYYADAALWLHAHAPPGAMIFQSDWDDFPRLFFYNSSAIYTAGLDPTYLSNYDADLYQAWQQITVGNVHNPSEPIREQFGALYVFSDLEHHAFLRRATADPNLEEVYRDEYAVIFRVKP